MPKMNVAKTNLEEIVSLHALLNELEWLHKELQRTEFEYVEWGDYEVLSKLGLVKDRGLDNHEHERTAEFFLEDLVRKVSEIHFQRILFNCEVLLNNCSDPEQDVLDWNADIKKGLELLQEWASAEPGRRVQMPVKRVKHADLTKLTRDSDPSHGRACPDCDAGTLVMAREPETMKLLAEDACLFCGQRVVYEDVVDGVLVDANH